MSIMDAAHFVERLLGWQKRRSNLVRQQAARVLQAFEAHGVARMQINQVLPQALRLTALAWSDPDELKNGFAPRTYRLTERAFQSKERLAGRPLQRSERADIQLQAAR